MCHIIYLFFFHPGLVVLYIHPWQLIVCMQSIPISRWPPSHDWPHNCHYQRPRAASGETTAPHQFLSWKSFRRYFSATVLMVMEVCSINRCRLMPKKWWEVPTTPKGNPPVGFIHFHTLTTNIVLAFWFWLYSSRIPLPPLLEHRERDTTNTPL